MSNINKSPFFHAYHTATQDVTRGNVFEIDTVVNCDRSDAYRVSVKKAFYYGEIQTDVAAANNNYEIELDANVLSLCQGFQCSNLNTVGTMDDGVYGVSLSTAGILYHLRYTVIQTNPERSDAHQTRLYGIRII